MYDEILACANVISNSASIFRIILPNLIDQLLRFQHIMPAHPGDTLSAPPIKFIIESMPPPAMSTEAPASHSASLAADLLHAIGYLTTMHQRLTCKSSCLLSLSIPSWLDVFTCVCIQTGGEYADVSAPDPEEAQGDEEDDDESG